MSIAWASYGYQNQDTIAKAIVSSACVASIMNQIALIVINIKIEILMFELCFKPHDDLEAMDKRQR